MFKYNVYLDFYVEHTILSIIFMIFVLCTAAVIFKNVFVVEKNYYYMKDHKLYKKVGGTDENKN